MSKIITAIELLKNNRRRLIFQIIHYFPWILSDKTYTKLMYYLWKGNKLNLFEPTLFSEKIQWLKLYDRKPEYTQYVDKALVKEHVASLIGEQYIIPTIKVWDKVKDIDWDILPDKFVLKTTHGGGNSGVIVVKEKKILNKQAAIEKLYKSMKQDIYADLREWPYKNVSRRILAEVYMEDVNAYPEGSSLSDYKFYCFNGEPKYCQVIRNRDTNETIDFYDMDWVHQEFVGLNPVAKNGKTSVPRPKRLNEMVGICRTLSKIAPFIRVDLYDINDRIYFGEITFYPNSGLGTFTPQKWDRILGDLLKIN